MLGLHWVSGDNEQLGLLGFALQLLGDPGGDLFPEVAFGLFQDGVGDGRGLLGLRLACLGRALARSLFAIPSPRDIFRRGPGMSKSMIFSFTFSRPTR